MPTQDSKVDTVVQAGPSSRSPTAVRAGFRFISYKGKGRWVKNQYLSTRSQAESAASAGGISAALRKSGSKVESGLTPDAIRVLPGHLRPLPAGHLVRRSAEQSDFHGSGQAVDSMISNSTVGWQLANWVRANAKRLGVSEVIYSQKIWTVQRGSEGWRSMSDRGSATANHYDHVHVSVYGNRGTA